MSEIRTHPWTTLAALVALGVALLTHTTTAPADAVAKVERSVVALKVSTLEAALIDTRLKQCTASQQGARDAFFVRRIGELQREYFSLAGRVFDLPECGEL